MKITSVFGELTVDNEGEIVDRKDPHGFLQDIDKVNMEEYLKWAKAPKQQENILAVGFWNKYGHYEPPVRLYREKVQPVLFNSETPGQYAKLNKDVQFPNGERFQKGTLISCSGSNVLTLTNGEQRVFPWDSLTVTKEV